MFAFLCLNNNNKKKNINSENAKTIVKQYMRIHNEDLFVIRLEQKANYSHADQNRISVQKLKSHNYSRKQLQFKNKRTSRIWRQLNWWMYIKQKIVKKNIKAIASHNELNERFRGSKNSKLKQFVFKFDLKISKEG